MIVSRAPVRFSLGGGGTDLPAYYREHGGFVVSAAIDKYVYVTANKRFYPDIRLAYSKVEIAKHVDAIEHPIFREALRLTGVTSGIELGSVADVPANSGLGSSSTFTVALLNALHTFRHQFLSSAELAEEACEIEMVRLGEPVGKQDQYMAAFGNLSTLTIAKDGVVTVAPLAVAEEVLDELSQNLVVFYTGVQRPASLVLGEQVANVVAKRPATTESMHRIKELGYEVVRLLAAGDVDRFGELLHEHWTQKRRIAASMTDPSLDEHYEAARAAGAIGGKLMGAGGGGFFMFYARPAERRLLVETMTARGLRHLRFRFERDGARIVANHHRT